MIDVNQPLTNVHRRTPITFTDYPQTFSYNKPTYRGDFFETFKVAREAVISNGSIESLSLNCLFIRRYFSMHCLYQYTKHAERLICFKRGDISVSWYLCLYFSEIFIFSGWFIQALFMLIGVVTSAICRVGSQIDRIVSLCELHSFIWGVKLKNF